MRSSSARMTHQFSGKRLERSAVALLLGVLSATADAQSTVRTVKHSAAAIEALPVRRVLSQVLGAVSGARGALFEVDDVERAILLDSNRLVVLGWRPSRIVVIDYQAGRARALGRKGSGPGEFEQIADIAVRKDTVFWTDWALMRASSVAQNGHILWTRRLPSPVTTASTRLAGVTSNGALVLSSVGVSGGEPDSTTRTAARVVLVTPTGDARTLQTIPDLYLAKVETRFRGRRRMENRRLELGSSASLTMLGNLIFATSGDAYKVNAFGIDGALRLKIEMQRPRREITKMLKATAIDIAVEQRVREHRGEPLLDPEESERLIRAARYADSLPAIHSLISTGEDLVWIVDGVHPADRGWSATAVRANGELAARLESRFPGVPLAIAKDRVLMKELDADGSAVLRIRSVR